MDTYAATFRLMQVDGVTGPVKTMPVESVQHAKELAVAWSMGELGHPWDVCTIEIPELGYVGSLGDPEERANELESTRDYDWAVGQQGFVGTYDDWKCLSQRERDKFEAGARGDYSL